LFDQVLYVANFFNHLHRCAFQKTGNEASVDRLMKQISGFMSEISDEFKVIIVDAIRSLCLKFPSKQAVMLGFISAVLRDEGGYEYKRAIVEAIFDLVKFIPECKEVGKN
jgi:coatomer protein complex subunit gamma